MITGVLEKKRRKLELGSVFVTPKATRSLDAAEQGPDELLARHEVGDWGEASSTDWSENDLAFCKGYRVFSIYHLVTGEEIWVITQPDRSATTIMLPEEY
jgi:hypothetical protein